MKKKTLLLILFFMFIATNALSQNTILGTVTGDSQAGVTVSVYSSGCGGDILVDTAITDAEGNYAIGDIENGKYFVSTSADGYSFAPKKSRVDISQAKKQYCNFTSAVNFCDFCGYKVKKYGSSNAMMK
jgi:hypothetical protein